MILPAPQFPPVSGESDGQRIARIVRSFNGCSLSSRRADLAALVGRGVDDESIVTIQTNCATFALGVLAAAGCAHPILKRTYVNGMAFSWLVQIGNDLGAWRDPATDGPPVTGAAMWYEVAGMNDDHVEWCVDASVPIHGGGGRPNNAITVGPGPIALSCGRPLHRWLDPERLGLPGWIDGTDEEPHS